MTASIPRLLSGEETTTSVPLVTFMGSAPTWALFRFLIKSSMGIDVIRDQDAGVLTLKDKNDDDNLKDANEKDFDDNDYAFAH